VLVAFVKFGTTSDSPISISSTLGRRLRKGERELRESGKKNKQGSQKKKFLFPFSQLYFITAAGKMRLHSVTNPQLAIREPQTSQKVFLCYCRNSSLQIQSVYQFNIHSKSAVVY
jgi:hypothetical protein